MTTLGDDPRHHDDPLLPASLQSQLRALAQPAEADVDLWPGIQARLPVAPQRASHADAPARRRPRRRRLAWLAMAASLVLAAGLGWRQQAAPAPETTLAAASGIVPSPPMLELQADAMTVEYAAALREVQAARASPGDSAALAVLDGSASAIRAALADDPDARFLLEHLRRVYARRLDITRQLA